MKIKNKGLYYSLISTFIILYLAVAFVSTLHAITFFQLANTLWLAILLGSAYEIGQASVLFSILMTENKNRNLAWIMMFLLTSLQISANVYASFKYMDGSGSNDWTYWQRSILFAVQAESPEMYKVIIAWIQGALLPLISLGLTALVAENIRLAKGEIETSEVKENEINTERIEHIINNEVKKRLNEQEKNIQEIKENIGDKEIEQHILSEQKNEPLIQQSDIVQEKNKIPEINLQLETKEIEESPKIYKKDKDNKFKISPVNKIKGWHLLNEFIDKEHNVFKKGKFIENNKDKEPTPKKASERVKLEN